MLLAFCFTNLLLNRCLVSKNKINQDYFERQKSFLEASVRDIRSTLIEGTGWCGSAPILHLHPTLPFLDCLELGKRYWSLPSMGQEHDR